MVVTISFLRFYFGLIVKPHIDNPQPKAEGLSTLVIEYCKLKLERT
jgi:hypothetical protein